MQYLHKSIGVLAIAAALAAVFRQAISSLNGRWLESGEFYSHGYLVLAISAWIFLREFKKEFLNHKPLAFVLPLLLAILCINFAAELASIVIVQEVLLPSALLLVIFALWGTNAGISLMLPILLLYFAIPVWDYLIPSLQVFAASFAGGLLNIIGIPVFIEEHTLSIPFGAITVAGGCSGLKYLIVANLIAVLYCYLNRVTGLAAATIVALATLFGLLANWIRVASLVLIGYYSQMQNQLIYQHVTFGWIIFAVSIVAFFYAAGFIHANNKGGEIGARGFLEHKLNSLPTLNHITSWSLIVFLLLCYVGGRQALGAKMTENEQRIASSIISTCPSLILQSPVAHLPLTAQTDYSFAEKRFESAGSPLVYYMGFGKQQQDKELISSTNRVIDLPEWQQADSGNGETIWSVYKKNNRTRLYEYAYYVGGHLTTSSMQAKLHQVLAALRGRGDAFLVLAEYECGSDCTTDRRPLESFISTLDHCAGYPAKINL